MLLGVILTQPAPAAAMSRVNPDRALASVDRLASFGTRHTLSVTDGPVRGIGAARNWLKSEFAACAGVDASLEGFDVPKMPRLPEGARVVNVVGVLPGSMPEAAERRYYVVGHYDTINSDRADAIGDAPGANDDASGTAVVLECARALAGMKLDATVVFLCTAGEEQGLVGAKYHADSARGRGELILGVLSNDIVGDASIPFIPAEAIGKDNPGTVSADTFVRIFSEGVPRLASAEEMARIRQLGAESDSLSRQIARFVVAVAEKEQTAIRPKMVFRPDRFLRGGDHSAFNEAGFPAVRFTVPTEDYSRQHVNVTEKDGKPYGDLAKFVSGTYVAEVARLNAATLVHLANAPRPPGNVRVVTAALETSTTLRWERSPEPDTAGYELVWRETTSPDWQYSKDVGDVIEFRTAASKDNVFFGVRAYDKDGYRSPVAFAGAAAK